VVVRVHHNTLGTYVRAGHPSRRYANFFFPNKSPSKNHLLHHGVKCERRPVLIYSLENKSRHAVPRR
jgi:hypothetical protein